VHTQSLGSRRVGSICRLLTLVFQVETNEAVCSPQSELFFRVLLKNTVRGVQIAAYPKLRQGIHSSVFFFWPKIRHSETKQKWL